MLLIERLMTIFSGRCSIRLSSRSIISIVVTGHSKTMACLTRGFVCALVIVTANAQTAPNYDDDMKPLIQRRCLPCHSSSEMRASLSLETFQGVMKGGGSG